MIVAFGGGAMATEAQTQMDSEAQAQMDSEAQAPGEIASPADWRGPDIYCSERWMRQLSGHAIDEIDAALRHAQQAGVAIADLSRETFPLPTFAADLAAMREELETGLGLQLYRGFPTERYNLDELRMIYWGLAKYIGTAVTQSHRGDIIGDVRDIGVDTNSAKGRGYTSNQRLIFHCDSADVTGLFCINTAKAGGRSLIVSSIAIHNEIARTRPDLLAVLHQPYIWSWQGQERAGELPYYPQPIYGLREGHPASRYIRVHIDNAQAFDAVPRLSGAQVEALDLVDTLCARADFHFQMDFVPGDIQFLNNHVTYHARTAFEDHDDPAAKRHLMRMWLAVPNSRPLPDGFAPLYRDVCAGAVRGGFPSAVVPPLFQTI